MRDCHLAIVFVTIRLHHSLPEPMLMRIFFPLLAAATCLLPSQYSHAATEAPATQPNIIIIYTDDMGYGDLGANRADGISNTPHLDKLASEGLRSTRFYVAQPVCSASRVALLTGCYPNRLGIHGALGPDSQIGINSKEMTIAELLKQKDYATAAFGKWHLGDQPVFLPTHHGFDEYLGLPYSNDMWPFHPSLMELTPEQRAKRKGYPPLPLIEGDQIVLPEVTDVEQTRLTTWYTQRAVKFIQQHQKRTFFLYLAHSMPHVPLYVSSKYQGKSAQGLYGDVIQEIDWSVGEILKTLKETGLEENTLIIFSSDNGPWINYGDHSGSTGQLREGKGTVWEGGVRVPFIARWPGKIPAGHISKEPFMTIDLLPTLAAITGATLPPLPIDGRNILPIFTGQPGAKNPHEAYFFYYHTNELQAVMSGNWKLYLQHEYRTLAGKPGGKDGKPVPYEKAHITEPELYDVDKDAAETSNVAKAHPDIVIRLLAMAENARHDLGDSLQKRTGNGLREPGRTDAN